MKGRQFTQEPGRKEQTQNRSSTKRADRELREHEHQDQRQVRMFGLTSYKSPGRHIGWQDLKLEFSFRAR
jgi:hypothetical protein